MKDLIDKLQLPKGKYKVIEKIKINELDYIFYRLENLGSIRLKSFDGDTYHQVYKLDEDFKEIEELDIILRPKYWIEINGEIIQSDEPIYFYCK